MDKVVNLTASYGGSGPVRVIGKPERRSSDSIQHDKFSCIFGFQQRVDELEGNFATEGTNKFGFAKVQTGETMIPGSDSNGDGTISVSEQQTWLENHASDTLPDGTDPFTKFTESEDALGESERANHPIEDYQDSNKGN